MFDYYFTFRSITGAQRGERAIRREGLRCSLQRAPKYLGLRDCGYALKVREGEALAAAAALRRWRADFVRLFRVGPDQIAEEVPV